MSQEVWMNDDFSGRVRLDVGVSAALLALAEDGNNEALSEIRAEQEKTRTALEDHPNVSAARVEEFTDAGLHHFVIDADVLDVRAMDQSFSTLFNPQGVVADGSEGISAPLWNFHVERAAGGAYAFVQVFDQKRPSSLPSSGAADDEFAQFGDAMSKAMLASMFGDRYVTVTLHAPRITSTTGSLDEAATTTQWKVALVDLLAGQSFHKELRAEFKSPVNWLLWTALLALIAAVMGTWLFRARIARRGLATF